MRKTSRIYTKILRSNARIKVLDRLGWWKEARSPLRTASLERASYLTVTHIGCRTLPHNDHIEAWSLCASADRVWFQGARLFP